MNQVAIVKPDHMGDLVLSVPAIRALQHRFGAVTLFASPANRFVADHFLPDVQYEPVALRYLQKVGGGITHDALVAQLKGYAVVVFLREDGVMQEVAAQVDALTFLERGSFERHETLTQRDNAVRVTGPYSRIACFPEVPTAWPTALRTVGLCVSAGFHANKWPLTWWAALGRRLVADGGLELRVIGGPAERDELRYLQRVLGLRTRDVIEGSRDLAAFREAVGDCDAVIGTDSGTLHLVSTAVPVLGIFTASPWKRFAPFGPGNRLLTAGVACSPCIQFMSTHYNACLTRECAMLIEPQAVATALFASPADRPRGLAGLQLYFDPAVSTGDDDTTSPSATTSTEAPFPQTVRP